MIEAEYMRRAIELAKRAIGYTNPNPMVGAVIVKDGRIIGEGYHKRCGELHAERNAIASLTESAEGATIYVTLEPCCHYGKTPPCTEAIIENKISRVVIGSRDPNPLVSGKGAKLLREHGIEVIEDFLREECDAINSVFFHYITTKKPYVVMKYAMTMDGKIATVAGESKWITGEAARKDVQILRGSYSAIMAGIGTVLADDPMLNCRAEGMHQPLRIVMDSKLRIPIESKLIQTAGEYPTMIFCADTDSEMTEKAELLRNSGVQVISLPGVRLDAEAVFDYLGEHGVDSVLVEGGGILNEAVMKSGYVKRAYVYIAPKLVGGESAKTPVEGEGIASINDAKLFRLSETKVIGEDVLLVYDAK